MKLFDKLFGSSQPMPLAAAILAGNIGDVRRHLNNGVNPNAIIEGENGYPLHYASHSYVNIMQLLIEHGADVNVRSDSGGTPLHGAAFVGYVEGVELLLKHNADVNARDNKGKTPLAVASEPTPLQAFGALLGAPMSAHEAEDERNRKKVAALLRAHGGTL